MRTLDDLRLSEGDLEQALRRSQLFDADFYLSQCDPADLAKDGKIDPIVHFIRFGAKDNYDPHPLFDTSFYKQQLPDSIEPDINPLLHFLMIGGASGLSPHKCFDSSYYLSENPDVREKGLNPLVHYLHHGYREGRRPNDWFDLHFYFEQCPEVWMFEINPLIHYVRIGKAHGRQFKRKVTFEPKDTFELSAQAARYYTALRQLEPLLPPMSEFPTITEYSYSKPYPAAAAYLRLAKLVNKPFEYLLVVGNPHEPSCEEALARALKVDAEKALLLSIDSGESVKHLNKRFGVRAIGVNDIMEDMASAQAVQVLLRLIVQAQPRVVHNFDSAVCWRVFERFHRAIKSTSHCYASLCDWRRDSDGAECGEFTSSFNMCLEHLDKIFLPSEAELNRLEHLYFLSDSIRSKIVLTNSDGVKPNTLEADRLRKANNVKASY